MSKKQFKLQEASFRISDRTPSTTRQRSAPETEADTTQGTITEADRTQVELWAAEMVLLTKELARSSAFSAQSALRLLALWSRLSRVEPGALPVPNQSASPLAEALQSVTDNAHQLVEAVTAIATRQSEAWLTRANQLKESYYHPAGMHPKEQERTAGLLLLDLDDLELSHCTAIELNYPGSTLDEGVTKCRQWLSQNVHAFLSCRKTVESELRILRQDLLIIDRELCQTVHKYLQIRTAIEEMDLDLSFAPPSARN